MTTLKRWWCIKFHTRITTPMHGKYTCLHCLQEHPVDYK